MDDSLPLPTEASAVAPDLSGAVPLEPVEKPKVSRWQRLTPYLPGPGMLLGLLLLASLLFRTILLTSPERSLIFDEVYYVNAARVIAGIHMDKKDTYAGSPKGLDPNREHPPLGKLIMAASIHLVGDNEFGWRIPSIAAGIVSILLMYLLVCAFGLTPWIGLLAAFLFAFDNLVLVHSRIGTLDMMLVMWLLAAAWLLVRRQALLAGVALGLASLTKVGGVYGFPALLLFLGGLSVLDWRETGVWSWRHARTAGLMLASYLVVWIGGLWLLDLRYSSFHTPWDHIHYMFNYGIHLVAQNGPSGVESYPWQWLINEVQIPYYRADIVVKAGDTVIQQKATIYFRGAMNPIIIGAAPLAIAYAAWRTWTLGDRLALWTITWFVGTYLPFYPLAMVEHRISYIFYFLPTLPAIVIMLAQLLFQGGLPRIVLWGYICAVIIGFIGYFPYPIPIIS